MTISKAKYIIISLVLLLASFSFLQTAVNLLSSTSRINELRSETDSLKREKLNLEKELEFQKSDYFIGQEARNKLNFVLPGEHVYVVDEDLLEKTKDAPSSFEDSQVIIKEDENLKDKSNAMQWFYLFL